MTDEKVGKEYWFEYHCWESPASSDAELWYRSHNKIKIISISEPGIGDTSIERGENGAPRVYKVKFEDGFEGDIWEDEVMKSPDEFYRPNPPSKKKINEYLLRTLIRETILLEYNDADSFLSDFELAKKYAYEHVDEVGDAIDSYKKKPNDDIVEYHYDYYMDLIHSYINKYNELKNKDSIEIYRLVKLNEEKDLDKKNIGMHWSFSPDGVGDYGGDHPKRVAHGTGNSFVLTGNVDPQFIDWVYGFSSFMWYGEDQWECALLKGAKVTITKINDKVLNKPIVAKVGNH